MRYAYGTIHLPYELWLRVGFFKCLMWRCEVNLPRSPGQGRGRRLPSWPPFKHRGQTILQYVLNQQTHFAHFATSKKSKIHQQKNPSFSLILLQAVWILPRFSRSKLDKYASSMVDQVCTGIECSVCLIVWFEEFTFFDFTLEKFKYNNSRSLKVKTNVYLCSEKG